MSSVYSSTSVLTSSLVSSNGDQIVFPSNSHSSFEADHIDLHQIASNRISTPETTITTITTVSEITNSDFMEAIFVDLLPDERPVVVEVYGDTIGRNPNFSGAKEWVSGHDFSFGDINHYFTRNKR